MPEEDKEKEAPKKKSPALEKIIPVLIILSIGLAFMVGTLWQKVQSLEKGVSAPQVTTGTSGSGGGNAAAPAPATNGKLPEAQASKIPVVSDDDHVRGSREAKLFLIEYSDYQCPFCKSFHPTAQQALDEYGDDLAWVYRHFPLDSIHAKARPTAEASECVAELGGNDAFWSFSDAVFEDSPTSLNDLSSSVTKAGVSSTAFQSCIDSDKYADRVESDYQEGLAAGVTGTPGSFLVNQKGEAWFIPGAVPFDSLKIIIDEALKS